MRALPWLLLVITWSACSANFDDAWDVYDLRLLGLQVEPPEHVYTIELDDEGVPQLDPTSFLVAPVTLTMLVVNPEAPNTPFDYRVEGCLLDQSLNCRDDAIRVVFAEGEALPGELSVPVELTPELVLKSFESDPFFGIFGAAVWIAGTVSVGEVTVPFLKSFALVPDYGQGRVANSNPVITGIWAGELDQEEPLVLEEGVYRPAAGQEQRLLPVFPDDVRETYVVKALDLATLEFTTDTTFQAVWEQSYDKELTEELTVSFYTTCGKLSEDQKSEALSLAFETEEDKEDKELGVTFTAPDKGACSVWFVANDGRGGVGWLELPVAVK
jgi:hypothetical protein